MERGDHLVSPRMGYDHHGLYIGNGEVIHYSGFSEVFDKGLIEVTSIDEFAQGNTYTVKSHLFAIYDPEERVTRAFSKLGEDSYSLVFNNCEHFVSWCFNGVKSSSQVNDVVSNTATIATNEYMKRKGAEAAMTAIAQQAMSNASEKSTEMAISAAAKSIASNTASTAAGITAASAVTGTTATALVSAVAAGSLTAAAAPIAVAVGVGLVAKKAFDWFFD